MEANVSSSERTQPAPQTSKQKKSEEKQSSSSKSGPAANAENKELKRQAEELNGKLKEFIANEKK